jgi:uncharacterized protein (DUF302 family)
MAADDTPWELQIDELGERSVSLRTDYESALEAVRAAASAVGFSIPTEFSPAHRINERHDRDFAPYTVLGLGVPAAAEHALEAGDPRVGALFPCRVVVREVDPGLQEVYHLDTMRLAQEVDLAPEDERWAALVAQIERMVDDAFARLGRRSDARRARDRQ